jgi:hypothetical protein
MPGTGTCTGTNGTGTLALKKVTNTVPVHENKLNFEPWFSSTVEAFRMLCLGGSVS